MKTWSLQKARAKFSEVVEAAIHEEPQFVTRRGKDAVVIVSYETFIAMTQAATSLDDALIGAPEELSASRDQTPVPRITLG